MKQRINLAISGDCRWEVSRRITMATIMTISCPVGWKTLHSVKVSLLIVQVPVQTERLNPEREEEEERELIRHVKISHCARSRSSPLHVSVSAHTDAYVTSTRSYIRMRDRKPLPPLFLSLGIGIHWGPFRSLPPMPFCTLTRSRGPEKRRNKNNKKCFLPFRLCISHLALSSLSIFFSFSLSM